MGGRCCLAGALTLSGTNTYTGNTRVDAGTLILSNACLCATSSVYVAKDSRLFLNFAATNTICSLTLGGYARSPGLYGAFASGAAFISGTGVLMVTNGPAAAGTVLIVR